MKLLVIGPDIRDLRRVKNFTGVQAYYICRELRKRGVELVFANGKAFDQLDYLANLDSGCDHCLALGLRWFTHQVAGCSAVAKTKVKGAVTQLHDGVIHDSLARLMNAVDCTFTFRDDRTRVRDWDRYDNAYHYIGWAADPELLYPGQDGDALRILIDHPYYKDGQPDITEAITKNATLFAHKWRGLEPNKVRVRRLVNGGAEDVTINDPQLKVFERKHVPLPDIAQEYRRTHVYMVTHKESVGLTCLELAMCGALVVAPAGMIYQDRLDTVRHVIFDGSRVPWAEIMDKIDIHESRQVARMQTWEKVVDRLLVWFGNYK